MTAATKPSEDHIVKVRNLVKHFPVDNSDDVVQADPSMGQDMQKGRRTEIEFLNGFIVREGEKIGVACKANAVLTDLVLRVERGELKADPKHITELRLN